jgi:uncharacterized membrane protein YqjE
MLWRIAGHLRGLGGHLAALASNRLELFGLEWQEETTRLLGHLALLLTAVALAGSCLLFATLGLLVWAWQAGHLLLVIGLVALVDGLLALACVIWLKARLAGAPIPFAATRAEFDRDRQTLCAPGGREA